MTTQPISPRVAAKRRQFIADVEEMVGLGHTEDEITEAMGYQQRDHFRRQLERIGRRDIVLSFMEARGTAPITEITHNMRSTS